MVRASAVQPEETLALENDKAPLTATSTAAVNSTRCLPPARRGTCWICFAILGLAFVGLETASGPPDWPAGPGPRFSVSKIPSFPLAGGGEMPALMMGGDDFEAWFEAAGRGAGLQTFYAYGNGAHIAPQIAAAGRANVFISTGIPCGCCGADSPRIEPMNATLAMGYIDAELAQLNTSYVDLLLFHHRCRTDAETASVWRALETAKRQGKARHIGVSNFNAHDLALLVRAAEEPIDVLEAHFGVGVMDFETLAFARAHAIHPVAFSSLSERSTDHPTLQRAVAKVAAAHGVSSVQAMMAYVRGHGLTVLSSCFSTPSKCRSYYDADLVALDVELHAHEMELLDNVTLGRRTCTDCYTDECQSCAHTLHSLGCDIGKNGMGHTFPVWGRSNPNGTACLACAARHAAAVERDCGRTDRGESLETMVPKACGI